MDFVGGVGMSGREPAHDPVCLEWAEESREAGGSEICFCSLILLVRHHERLKAIERVEQLSWKDFHKENIYAAIRNVSVRVRYPKRYPQIIHKN